MRPEKMGYWLSRVLGVTLPEALLQAEKDSAGMNPAEYESAVMALVEKIHPGEKK